MPSTWTNFFTAKLPAALIAVVLGFQLAALALSHVKLHRFESDGFPDAVAADKEYHQAILFGDSVTRNATRYYNVGDEKTVLNLSTHGFYALPGDILLLRRYLQTHKSPKLVEIVSTPTMFTEPLDPEKLHYYHWRVFNRPDEHAYLKQLVPTIDARAKYPAFMDIQQSIFEPLTSSLRHEHARYYTVGSDPNANAVREPASTDVSEPYRLRLRISQPMNLLPAQAQGLHDLCALSAQYGFQLDIAWAPVPKPLLDSWKPKRLLEGLQDQILSQLNNGCAKPKFTNFNDDITYVAFDRAALHVRGFGWEQVFAYQMKAHIKTLLAPDSRP